MHEIIIVEIICSITLINQCDELSLQNCAAFVCIVDFCLILIRKATAKHKFVDLFKQV